MAYAIGCIGTSTEQRTKVRTMTKEQRAKNNSLIPKLRNQSRDIAFIEITSGDLGDGKSGHLTKVRAVKNGQLGHYASAFYFGRVRYLTNAEGTRIVHKNPGKKLYGV
jgi:hypothetical protein